MKTKNITPSNVPTTPATVSGFTLGLDLGDRQHHVCVLDAAGNIVREAALPNTRPALAQLLVEFPKATVALEAGTHSPWIPAEKILQPGQDGTDGFAAAQLRKHFLPVINQFRVLDGL